MKTVNCSTELHEYCTPCECECHKEKARENPLQKELLDLITLMPDSQTQEIVDYILSLRETRRKHADSNSNERGTGGNLLKDEPYFGE